MSMGNTRKEIMRCLKRFVAREVFAAITNPPRDPPTGPELRQLRLQHGLSRAVCSALATNPINLPRIERGLAHDTRLDRRARTWLLENAA